MTDPISRAERKRFGRFPAREDAREENLYRKPHEYSSSRDFPRNRRPKNRSGGLTGRNGPFVRLSKIVVDRLGLTG